MKIYDNYFQVIKHIENNNREAFTWMGIDSSSLAEVMEEAEIKGYSYRLNCYDEQFDFKGEKVTHHKRTMIFTPREIQVEKNNEQHQDTPTIDNKLFDIFGGVKQEFINDACKHCSNHPLNGGSGICHCILGNTIVY